MDQFLLTAAELELHRARSGETIWALVTGIHLRRGEGSTIHATEGTFDPAHPWETLGITRRRHIGR